MTVEIVRDTLAWCAVINYGVLLVWFGMFAWARSWVYELHSRWFKLSPERFDAIHYAAMAWFKLLIFVFNLVPYLALRIVA